MNDSGVHGMLESTPSLCKLKPSNALTQTNPPSPIVPIHSSTLNDSLVASVELWNLKITPNVTPSTSATTSPSEFFKNHQESLQKTPLKATSCAKLGSPERNEIISGRKPTVGKCIITPKIERSSPAKKRLFGVHNVGSASAKSLLAAHTKHDPVNYFMRKRNVRMVVEQIFGELKDGDLYNCRRVSRTWREAVDSFPAMRKAALEFANKIEVNKENPNKLRRLQSKGEGERSFTGVCSDKFIQLGQTLKENQRLTKCQHCQNPQIVEYGIGQCLTCGYICCFKCNSFSHDGPEHFVDKCNSSALDIPKHLKRRRTLLMDSPPRSQLSFLSFSSSYSSNQSSGGAADNSHLYANTSKDSCYGSYEDTKMSISHTPDTSLSTSLSVSNGQRCGKRNYEQRMSTQLDEQRAKRQARTSNLYTPVVQLRKSPEKNPLEESPEKDYSKYKGAGTVASKKRLRRLLR